MAVESGETRRDRRLSTDRRRGSRRREDHAGEPRFWRDLHRPVRALVYVLILLALIEIYHQAAFIVDQVFGVILLFVFAAIIAMLITPLVDALERTRPLKGRRGLAVLTLNIILVVALGAFLAALIPSLVAQGTAFSEQAPKLSHEIQASLDGFEKALKARGIPVNLNTGNTLQTLAGPVLGSAFGVVSGTVGVFVNLVLITVISIYLELQGRELVAMLRQLFPRQQEVFDFSLVAAGSTLAGYVRGQVIFATVMSVYTGLVLGLIGVHFALIVAVVTFFLELVPIVGAPVAIGVACAVAVLQGQVVILETAVASMVGHTVGAYTVGLRLLSRSTRVHPLVALAALLLGAELGGIVGALFAVPIAGILNVYAGAIYRFRRGQQAFVMPETTIHHESTLDQLPRFGEEISQLAEEDAVTKDPVPRVRTSTRSTAARRAKASNKAPG